MRVRFGRVALLAGISATSAIAGAGCGGHSGEKTLSASTTVKPVPVTVAKLEHREVERTVEVVGSLRAWEQITIGSKKEGRVVKVFHDLGDLVKPGEPLVLLEKVDADLAVAQSTLRYQAELARIGLKEMPQGTFDVTKVPAVVKANVALERTRLNVARDRSLVKRNAGALQDFQNSENDEKAAEAVLADAILAAQSTLASAQAAKADLDIALQARVDLEVRAPLPSRSEPPVPGDAHFAVSKRSVSEGQFLKVGDPIMELVIEKPLRLWTSVPERFTDDVKLGQSVRVHVPAFTSRTFEGKVVRINPTVDATSRTFQVETIVTNDDGKLRPGGFAKASIVIDMKSKATVVPLESVVTYAGVTKLFVVEGEKARAINVEAGQENKGWVEVIGDVPADGIVVTTGQSQLAEGTPVLIRTPETAKAKNSSE